MTKPSDYMTSINEAYMTARRRFLELNRLQSEVDSKLTDIDHAIELYDFNACQGFKIQKMRKDLLQERRKIKNEHAQVQFIVDRFNFIIDPSTIKKFEEIVKREENGKELKTYNVRFLHDVLGKTITSTTKSQINL